VSNIPTSWHHEPPWFTAVEFINLYIYIYVYIMCLEFPINDKTKNTETIKNVIYLPVVYYPPTIVVLKAVFFS